MNRQEKLTLIVDGNWLLMSRFFMVRDNFNKNLSPADLEKSSENLADIMAQSISIMLRQFQGMFTNVIFVSDNRSWRKELPLPSCMKDKKYKGTRSQEQEYDWSYVFRSVNVLSQRFKDSGFTTSNAYGVEGDDWCWWWSRKLNAEDSNVILWTVDEDVKQLVQVDPSTGYFTGWYEKKKGLVLPEDLKVEDVHDDLDFFMTAMLSNTNPLVSRLSTISKVTYINPKEIINKKILVGDTSDNILPVFTYEKAGKTYKATMKDWEKIINESKDNYNRHDDWSTYIDTLYDNIYNIKHKQLGTSYTSREEFAEHITYNRKLVWLDESQFPDSVKAQMINAEYMETSENKLHDLRFNWTMLSNKNDELDDLLSTEMSFS